MQTLASNFPNAREDFVCRSFTHRTGNENVYNNIQSLADFAVSFLSIRMRLLAKMFTGNTRLTHRTAPSSIGLSLYESWLPLTDASNRRTQMSFNKITLVGNLGRDPEL